MKARETGGLPPSDTTDGIDTQTDAIRTDGGADGGYRGASPRDPVPEHYWVECRRCGEETVAFERYCRHCDFDRHSHRDENARTDGGTESLDLDIPDTVNGVKLAEAKLRDHFKATEVQLDTHDPDGAVSIRLQFRGFSDLDAALDKVSSVARRLDALPEAENIHCGVNTDGAYDPQIDEQDERPAGWVNADIDPDRSPDVVVH